MSKKQVRKRIIQILIVLIGVSFFTFMLTYLSPGDPAEIMLTECGNLPTPELLEQTRHELGLDQPFLVQYGNWVKGVLTGDMGARIGAFLVLYFEMMTLKSSISSYHNTSFT